AYRASVPDIPSDSKSAARCSRWNCISSAISVSTRRRERRGRRRCAMRRNGLTATLPLGRAQHLRDDRAHAVPVVLLGLELLSAGWRQAVVLRTAVVLGDSLLRLAPA